MNEHHFLDAMAVVNMFLFISAGIFNIVYFFASRSSLRWLKISYAAVYILVAVIYIVIIVTGGEKPSVYVQRFTITMIGLIVSAGAGLSMHRAIDMRRNIKDDINATNEWK